MREEQNYNRNKEVVNPRIKKVQNNEGIISYISIEISSVYIISFFVMS